VAGIEEARWPSLRGRLAVQQGLGVRHREPPLLERLTHRSKIFGPLRAVEDLAGALVGLYRLLVALLRVVGDTGHPDVDVQRPNIVAKRN